MASGEFILRRFNGDEVFRLEAATILAPVPSYEHDDLNDNAIEFVERTGELFRVRWTGRARDVNFYDGSKPETTIEIDGWFRFEEFKKWSGTTST